jgi:protein ImuB
MTAAIADTLAARDQGARRLVLSLYRVDGMVRAVEIATSAPMRDPARMAALFADRFARLEGGLEPGYGFDLIALEATATGPLAPRQDESPGLGGAAADGGALGPLIDRLAGRLGPAAVRRMVPAGSHLPERAVVLAPVLEEVLEAAGETPPDWSGAPWRDPSSPAPLARPLQLLPAPEPIEAVAEVPDGAPVRFTWRRLSHRVIAADGPERLAPEWWQGPAASRDYFRLEDEAGRRFWVYRLGLWGRETAEPRWYMHGLLP